MFILVGGATTTVYPLMAHHPNLGVLLDPRGANETPPPGVTWAADNGAFAGFDEYRFRAMLEKIDDRITRHKALLADCRFVTSPDVVGDHDRTLELWRVWSPTIRKGYSLPPGFVAQDGCTADLVPWSEVAAVFIGGTTEFKLGEAAADIVAEANERGIWSHMGRVNSARRIVYASGLDCRSIDGSSFSRFARTHLAWALPLARTRQGRLPFPA